MLGKEKRHSKKPYNKTPLIQGGFVALGFARGLIWLWAITFRIRPSAFAFREDLRLPYLAPVSELTSDA